MSIGFRNGQEAAERVVEVLQPGERPRQAGYVLNFFILLFQPFVKLVHIIPG